MSRKEKALAGLGQGLLQAGMRSYENKLETERQTALSELNARYREQMAQADFGRQQALQEDQQAFQANMAEGDRLTRREDLADDRTFRAEQAAADRALRRGEGLLDRAAQQRQLDQSADQFDRNFALKERELELTAEKLANAGRVQESELLRAAISIASSFEATPEQRKAANDIMSRYLGTGSGPSVGMVVDGFRFKGGDPADERSWEPAR